MNLLPVKRQLPLRHRRLPFWTQLARHHPEHRLVHIKPSPDSAAALHVAREAVNVDGIAANVADFCGERDLVDGVLVDAEFVAGAAFEEALK